MPVLYHHPFCPQSRFIRLVLGEYGVPIELVEERVAERRPKFPALDPAGRFADRGVYRRDRRRRDGRETTRADRSARTRRGATAGRTVHHQTRRCGDQLAGAGKNPQALCAAGRRAGDGPGARAANMRHHMRYIDAIAGLRRLSGRRPRNEHKAAKEWHRRLKSRPAFRPLLADRVPGMAPAPYNAEIDF